MGHVHPSVRGRGGGEFQSGSKGEFVLDIVLNGIKTDYNIENPELKFVREQNSRQSKQKACDSPKNRCPVCKLL